MSRTAMIAFVLTLFLLGKAALAAPCCDRIQGFNVADDYDDKLRPRPHVSEAFEIEDYSNDSAFGFLLVKAPADARLEIGFLKSKSAGVGRTVSFTLERSPHHKGALQAADFDGSAVFRGKEKAFVFRLVKADGSTLCEDQPKPIYAGH